MNLLSFFPWNQTHHYRVECQDVNFLAPQGFTGTAKLSVLIKLYLVANEQKILDQISLFKAIWLISRHGLDNGIKFTLESMEK